jgi:hypothetical protein
MEIECHDHKIFTNLVHMRLLVENSGFGHFPLSFSQKVKNDKNPAFPRLDFGDYQASSNLKVHSKVPQSR